MRSPRVSGTVGRRGRVTLLLENPHQPVQDANRWSITIFSHISKLHRMASYALATAIYDHALVCPCLRGGMRGVSLGEVVRTVHMNFELAKLQRRVGRPDYRPREILRRDHPQRSAHQWRPCGHGGGRPPGHPHEGLPVIRLAHGPRPLSTLSQLLGTPKGTIQGVHAGATAAPGSALHGQSRDNLFAFRDACGWSTQ